MKKAKLVLALALVITLIGAFIASGVQTVGGTVSIKTVSIAAEDGRTISALLFVPATATDSTPAPAVLINHGYLNVKEHVTDISLELARRGYVVLAPDMSGHGYSEQLSKEGQFFGLEASAGVNAALLSLYNMSIVDNTNIAVVGHSLGGHNSAITELKSPDKIKTLVLLGYSPFFEYTSACNTAIVVSEFDEFPGFWFGTAKITDGGVSANLKKLFNTEETIVPDQLYGSFENGTARQWFMPATTHPGNLYRSQPIADTISFIQSSSAAPNPIAPNNQIWQWHQLGTLIALLGFAFSIFASASLLLKTKFFGALVQASQKSSGLKGIWWWIMAVVVTAIPALTLFTLGNLGAKIPLSTILPVKYSNITFTWAVGNGIIFLAMFLVWHFVSAKLAKGRNTISYGLSTNAEIPSFKWASIGKSLLLAICTLGIPYILLCLVFSVLKVDYRFIVVMFHPMDFVHFKVFLVYLIPSILFFFASSLISYSWFRTKAFSGIKSIIPYIANALIVVLGLVVLNLMQYVTLFATGSVKFPDVVSSLLAIAEWQLIPLLALASGIATYLNKKTSNIYAGVFTSAALVAWYSICINAIEVVLK
jgi:pimeloyl-ACP methyl ester carboxylesterase